MANAIFTGDAEAVAQVNTETPANVEIGDIFGITLTDHEGISGQISFTATAAAVGNVTDGLHAAAVAAKAGGEVPWTRATTTEDDAAVTITADTAGDPFTVATTAVNGGAADTQTLTDASVTANAGPNILSLADNILSGTALAATNDLIIPAHCTVSIYGEDLSGTELNSVTIEKGYGGDIGSPNKPLQLDLAASKLFDLAGTGNIYLAPTGATATVYISQAGVGAGEGTYGMNLETGEAAMAVNISCENSGQRVGVAALAGKTGTFTPIKVTEGEVKIGTGVTVGDITTAGGVTHSAANVSGAINNEGGTFHREGSSTVATWNANKGKAFEKSSGTATAVHIACPVDCTKDLRARTWTDTDLYPGAKLIDPHKTITHTNDPSFNRCGLEAVDWGVHFDAERKAHA